MNAMAKGDIPVTHSFYLKLFHVLVKRGVIQLPFVDKLLVDEAQDLSAIALDIIEAIPTGHLVIVGDQNQRIFEFLDLENGFERFADAKVLTLTQSFRVDNMYAPAIQEFLNTHLNASAEFRGMLYPADPVIRTKAYISRNNVTLIGKMIELNSRKVPYNLSSSAKLAQMFKLPLALAYAKPGHVQRDHELKHLQHDIDEYGKQTPRFRETTSLFKYLKSLDEVQPAIKAAINLILSFGSEEIINAYEKAKEHKGTKHQLTLLTAHTSKGATFDEVELDDDLNLTMKEILTGKFKGDDNAKRAELCLYFVSVTRHRHNLINAQYLNL
jgi:superfamily I DNA/RNA helicase